jgi:hypothetical protein
MSTEGEVLIREEERENHMHLIGTTGEGKSRFLELLIRDNIRRGSGACFLDPSDRGETMYNILRYCAKIGYKKVCLIDPHTIYSRNRLTAIQPFHYEKSYKAATVANLMDNVRVLFQSRDAAETPRIQKYLSALIHALLNAEMTLHEALYFTNYKYLVARRKTILSYSEPMDRHRLALDEVFETYPRFNNEFSSTVRRLEPFLESSLDLMFAADEGVDFVRMIADGWVILVNLYSGLGIEPIHTRLLGTTVINELLFALDRLHNRGWKGVYYLYLDEAGRYANRNLADLLAYKRKSGLRVTVAHQYFKQFEDPYILEAVKQLCKTKVMFNTPNPADRLEAIKMLGYGGDIPASLASFANADLPKQYAVIKKGKESPVRIRIPDVLDALIDKKLFDSYLGYVLTQEWNYTPDEVREMTEKRFVQPTKKPNTRSPSAGAKTNRPTGGKDDPPPKRSVFED